MNQECHKRDIIVISAINLRSGGPLTILRDCLTFLSRSPLSKEYKIVALVHDKNLAYFDNIEYIEFPKSCKSWFFRLYYEYIYFYILSKKLKPLLWLSLHDTTPNVQAKYRAVYMHNPSIVNKIKSSDWKFDKTYIIFAWFYKYVYLLNIKRNNFYIVQQNWFKNAFVSIFKVPESKFIVARPKQKELSIKWSDFSGEVKSFFFPSYPRPFKNFEVICEAARILQERGYKDIEIMLSIDDKCGKYGQWIHNRFADCNLLKFVGIIDPSEMFDYYNKADCLIFPSRLESWGLPISEFLTSGRPMIVADEPYAHETTQGADKVAFFETNNSLALADVMEKAINNDFSLFKKVDVDNTIGRTVASYEELFDLMLKEINNDNK